MPNAPECISIAVVEHEGRYLVGARGADAVLPGRAEFPGGKCEPGEATADCAVRECLEETGLRVVPVRLLLNRPYQYLHGAVDLHFWLCRPDPKGGVADEHLGFRWVPASELPALHFPEANEPVIAELMSGSGPPAIEPDSDSPAP